MVSLGTTSPETFVSVMAAYMGNPGLALGNGVGSIYLFVTYLWAKQGGDLGAKEDDGAVGLMGIGRCWAGVIGGLVPIIVAARLLVPATSEIAVRLGVPDGVIAATLVAFGTSLPEPITAIAAVRKGVIRRSRSGIS